jgi:septal ring factor EnvC (AmiA/AmiB activator)
MRPAKARAIIYFVSAYLLSIHYLAAQENPSQADLDALARSINRVQSQIDQTREARSTLESQIEIQERSINRLLADIEDIQSQIRQTQNRLSELEREAASLLEQRLNQQSLIANYLRAAYLNGQEEYLKLLLNQQDISQSARMLRYYQYFSQARNNKIAEFDNILLEISKNSTDLAETRKGLQQQQASFQSQQAQLQEQQNERLSLVRELDGRLASSSSELSRLEIQYEEMQILIEELARAILEMPLGTQSEDFFALRGELPWPLQGAILNRFGTAYQNSDLRWEGITIAGNIGAEISAVHRGRVIYADWFSSSGLLLIIDHGGGYMSLYAHNQSLFKAVGDWVLAGETIASVGNSGGRGEEGVYFEIRYNGDAQDPLSWLRAR